MLFKANGFEFKLREVPNGMIASIVRPIEVDFHTVEDLIDFQKRLGYPIKIEDGHLEVVA